MSRFEQQLFEYFSAFQRNIMAQPLMLGGAPGSGGGYGGRPGGFTGYLPQTRVAYDMSEDATLITVTSGQSLLDNLNHIRARIQTLETSSGLADLQIQMNDILIATGVTIVNFEGAVNVVDNGGGKVTVTISGNTVHNQYLFTVDGVVVSGELPWNIYSQSPCNIEEVFLSTRIAPVSSDIRVNVLRNGATIFQAPEYVAITTGNTTGSRNTNLINNSLSKDDYIQADVVQGDATAEDLVIHVRYTMEV